MQSSSRLRLRNQNLKQRLRSNAEKNESNKTGYSSCGQSFNLNPTIMSDKLIIEHKKTRKGVIRIEVYTPGEYLDQQTNWWKLNRFLSKLGSAAAYAIHR